MKVKVIIKGIAAPGPLPALEGRLVELLNMPIVKGAIERKGLHIRTVRVEADEGEG